MNWTYREGNWVLWPPAPKAILHFLGGAFVATFPQTTYQRLLFTLAKQGYGIIATPFVIQWDHHAIASDVKGNFGRLHQRLIQHDPSIANLPIFGLGHSMGCKLHLLLASTLHCHRAGNILMSFNNFNSEQSVPFANWFQDTVFQDILAPDFTPSPRQTLQLLQSHYAVPHNLLIQFSTDELDQTHQLSQLLNQKFGDKTQFTRLSGNHLTPLGQDIQLAPSSDINPLEEFGQWLYQQVYREIHHLEQTIVDWLRVMPHRHTTESYLPPKSPTVLESQRRLGKIE